MSPHSDTATTEGATNVVLNQRESTSPFARKEMHIKGSEAAGRAIGFDQEGKLATLLVGGAGGSSGPVTLADMAPLERGKVIGRKTSGTGQPEAVTTAEMVALDPAGVKGALGKVALSDMANLEHWRMIARTSGGLGVPEAVTLPQMIAVNPPAVRAALEVDENPFKVVDNESQFNAALTAGRWIRLRGEGSGGTVNLTTSKDLNYDHLVVEGPAILRSTLVSGGADDPQNRGLVINANDITLRNFKFTSGNHPVETGADVVKGICFNLFANVGHRTKLQDLEVYNWSYCLHKQNDYLYMNPGTTPIFSSDDVLIERCFCHTVSAMAAILTFGFRRLVVRDSRFLNWLTTPPALGYLTSDAFYGGSDWRDCVFENCHFGNASLMGLELLPRGEIPPLGYVHQRTRLTGCKSENCDSMGFSLGFGHGFIVEKCVAKNIRWMGFEIGGRLFEHPESAGHPTFLSQALIEGCEVETLRSAVSGLSVNGPVHGFSIDGARDTIIRNNRLRDIKSETANADVGIYLLDSERCTVQGNVLEDCGRTFILAERIYSSDKTGFHEISNNVFRKPAPYPQSSPPHNQRAIYIKNQTATIGYHVAYQRAPDSALYYVSELSPGSNANVMVDGVLIPEGICLIHNGSADCPGSPCYIMPGNYP